MSEDKKLLRRELVALRRAMSENVRKELDERIYNNLAENGRVRSCGTFLVYASSPDEVDTRRFINALLAGGKTVAVPKCTGKDMAFLTVKSLGSLTRSSFGVDEPTDGTEITEFRDTVCVVPGLRFDRNGYRLGWGGGFYDRFLARYSGYSVGICYECCCGDVPADTYDVPVDAVITENGIFPEKPML
ncbi:MAG: 5-formyltetrahydrofolate cyclo-ligase [Ruminiclostridium sp.]|nr:5-formyltetrahydrofolate cyclo-ligase [Ruminiclostridium sp.]